MSRGPNPLIPGFVALVGLAAYAVGYRPVGGGIAIGAVLALRYSMFDGWGIAVRNDDLGRWITGFCVAGATVPWRAIFSYVTHDRAMSDETLGHHMPLRKVA